MGGSLKVQTTWRCYKSKKIANHKRKRRDFHIAHPRVIALAKKTHRPLGFYEQELKTVAMMANIGLTEERLTKIEEKMKFILKPWYKRRLTNEKFKTYSTFIQQYIPKRNRPLPSQEVQNRDVLQEFFKYMHMTVANFNTIHCPWKETTTATFIKMKVVIKIVNAKAKFREDGGIKHWNLFQLQDTIAERGGCIIPAGKPTYFPKMPVLSPQTFGIWKIPMEHADPELGNLPRATDVQLMMNGGFGSDDEESVDGGPTREELYLQALMEDGIADRDERGLAGLIGGDLLGINEDGDAMPSYHGESRQSQGGWSNAFGSDDGREADELEEEDTLPQVQMPPQMSDLEIAKEEQRADQLLNLVRRLDEKKLKKRKKRKKHEASAYAKLKKQLHSTGSDDDDDEDEEDSSENEFSDDEISAIDWDLMSEAEQELNKEVEGEETASQLLEEMNDMELDEQQVKERKENAEQNAHAVHQLPFCVACKVRNHMQREAQRLCHGCALPYCIECYRLSHKKNIYQFHKYTTYEHILVTHAAVETRKEQDYDDRMLKYLERVNPRQYRRKKAITRFQWTDALMQIAGQIFLNKDWENSSEIDMGDTIELIRELLKKRADEMPSVRVAVRNGWKFLAHGMSITYQELIAFLPIYDAYFKHQVIEKLKKEGSKDGLGFDPTIFI